MSDRPPDSSPSESGVTLQAGGDIKAAGNIVGRDSNETNNIITNVFTGQRDSLEHRNRRAMLEKVRHDWVKGVLEQSLHGAALIELGMEYKPEAVQYPWSTVLQRPDQPAQPLPTGTKTSQAFDEVSGELLILGAPGSGKTTMLLDLARDLIARAEQDETLPIPVVFNLSSWAEKRPPLNEWLVDELRFRYDVPKKIATAWVQDDYVLPLLDGLDEVKLEHRAACVEAINRFRQEHGLLPTVVCSRSADYEALNAQLRLRGAILLQSLTRKQIDTYLQSAGEQLTSVRVLLQRDVALQELAESPLMLSIMALAYQGVPVESLPELITIEAQRKHLFDKYVQRMFERRGVDKRYAQQQAIHWLSGLAGRMVENGQTTFYLERMQPSLLKSQSQQWRYNMVVALVGGPEEEIKTVETLRWLWPNVKDGLLGSLVIGLLVGLLGSLVIGLFIGLFGGLSIGLVSGLVGGLSIGLFFALDDVLSDGLQVGKEIEIKTSPNQGVWRSARNAILVGLVGGLVGGLVVGFVVELSGGLSGRLIGGLVGGLVSGLLGKLAGQLIGRLVGDEVGWLFGGLSGRLVDGEASVMVSELFGFLIFGLLGILLGVLLGGLGVGLVLSLRYVLQYGGLVVIQHFTLRFFLYYSGWTFDKNVRTASNERHEP